MFLPPSTLVPAYLPVPSPSPSPSTSPSPAPTPSPTPPANVSRGLVEPFTGFPKGVAYAAGYIFILHESGQMYRCNVSNQQETCYQQNSMYRGNAFNWISHWDLDTSFARRMAVEDEEHMLLGCPATGHQEWGRSLQRLGGWRTGARSWRSRSPPVLPLSGGGGPHPAGCNGGVGAIPVGRPAVFCGAAPELGRGHGRAAAATL